MRTKKKTIAVLLSAILAINMASLTVFAEEPYENLAETSENTDEVISGDVDGKPDSNDEDIEEIVDEKSNFTTVEDLNIQQIESGEQQNSNKAKEAQIGKIEVTDYDAVRGTFRIVVSNITNADQINKITIPVWSEMNGQDDIIWYDAKKDNSANYYADINIRNHKYSIGMYNIHVYYTDNRNLQHFVGNIQHNVEVERGELSVTQNNDKEYTVELKNVKVPGGILEVQFPTWSSVGGQDDIRWYSVTKDKDDIFRCKISILNHKGLGEYNIHAYVKSPNGNLTCIGATGFKVDAPTVGKIEVTDYNAEKGTFRVVISDVSNPELIKKVSVPIWSSVDGQDDIIWYEAQKDKTGNYYVDVDVKKHKYSTGIYNIHVYGTDITGAQFFAGREQHNVAVEKGELSVIKNNDKEYTVELKNIKIPGGISEVQFPTWSVANGQDDIKWYRAGKALDGVYRYKISIGNHKGLGDYNIHAYAKSLNGSLTFIGATGFKVDAPAVGKIEANITNKENGQFQIKLSDIKNANLIKEVRVPVWSEKNQGDIIWYKALAKDGDGNYILNVNVRDHKYNCGIYNIHVYITDVAGGEWFAGTTNCNMNIEYDTLEASDIDGTETTYKITLSGLKVPSKEKSVQFAVWGSQGGQNDIKWYPAVLQKDGSYTCDIKILNHKEFGEYIVHAYCITKSNILQFIDKKEFTLVKKPIALQIQASDIDGTAGTFKVVISGVTAPSGVREIQVPVWCAANQSDVVWYKAIPSSDSNTYTVNVKVSNHGHHFGDYKIHVYTTMGNGIQLYTGAASASIKAQNYVYSTQISPSRREVGIMGAVNASRVQFPTWSDANGQDDTVWYEGVNRGNGNWNVEVNSANHRDIGAYSTHVYVTAGGKTTFAGRLSYSLTSEAEERLQRDVTAVYNQVGRELYACYNWVVNTMTYQTINGHIVPPAGYTREQWYAVMGLETHRGNCYCYAAAFAYLARHLGYNAQYVEGSVPRRGGGYTGHGWVIINGAYICDPEAQAEIGGRSFYMQPISSPAINYVW